MRSSYSTQEIFHRYVSARKDFLHGKYKLAIKKLSPVSLISDNSDANHLLVDSLYHQHDYSEAERVLLTEINSYTSSNDLVKLMINVLLKNNEFIICYEIVASFRDDNLKQRCLHKIKFRETNLIANRPKLVSNIAKKFYHLSSVSIIRQRIRLKRAQHLPLSRFIEISRILLVDPFLVPIMRLSILDIFRKINLKLKLRYRWIDNQIYVLSTSNLNDLTETKSYRRIMKIIKSRYFHDPSRMIALKQILRLDLSYLYPFNDQKVCEYSLWVKIAELRLRGEQPAFINQRIKSIYLLQVKLNRLTKNLLKSS